MEMKLGMHVCNIITTLFEQQQIASSNFIKNCIFTPKTNGTTHGDET